VLRRRRKNEMINHDAAVGAYRNSGIVLERDAELTVRPGSQRVVLVHRGTQFGIQKDPLSH
jgi:hypothetical protein